MDQRRLFLAIAISLVILLGFQFLSPPPKRPAATANAPVATQTATAPKPSDTLGVTTQDAGLAPVPTPANTPRLTISGPRVQGSVSLVGARLDDLILRDYRETLAKDSPEVRVLEPQGEPQPYYADFGWTGEGVKLPDRSTLWATTATELSPGKPATLTWDNGAGLVFEIGLALDDDYMFTVQQRVRNTGATPVTVQPYQRIRRDYTPPVSGYYILHEGMVGVVDGKLQETKYAAAKSDGDKNHGVAFTGATTGGWSGITDKYWLAALIPPNAAPATATYRHTLPVVGGKETDGYQVDYVEPPTTVAPAGDVMSTTRVFAGAKEVHLLDRYQSSLGIIDFWKAVDFGWFSLITRPFFYGIDWLYQQTGNFGIAILIFTFGLKLLFLPLANKSYRSMSKMKLLAPKMAQLREQYKDEPAKLQPAMLGLYKTEKVNPASGCLPMLIQIPVFFSLYKVIFVTIEMRQAPFFGWIRDLSAIDPTNVFNLFGLIPFDPAASVSLLHLGAWPLIMGATMFFQQRMNPPPPDPTQAKLFQFMPIIFTFMLARFPAGLVIYWSWNNLLTIGQQWLIMRSTRLTRPSLARV